MAKTLKEAIDPRRLIRSAKVRVFDQGADGEKLPEFHYMALSSSNSPYYLHTNPHLDCDCPDFTIRGEICKHLIKALAVEGDPHVLSAIHEFGLAPHYGITE